MFKNILLCKPFFTDYANHSDRLHSRSGYYLSDYNGQVWSVLPTTLTLLQRCALRYDVQIPTGNEGTTGGEYRPIEKLKSYYD